MITIIAKQNADFHRQILEKIFPKIYNNHRIFFAKTMQKLTDIDNEFATEKDNIPMLVFIDKYLYGENTRCHEITTKYIGKLKNRKQCIVISIVHDNERSSPEKMIVNERDMIDRQIFTIIEHRDIREIVEKKDYKKITKILMEIFEKNKDNDLTEAIKKVLYNKSQ